MAKPYPRTLGWQIRQLAAEQDQSGRQRYTHMQIAKALGVSETTVFRAIHNQGRFANEPLPEAHMPDLIEQLAKESLKRFEAAMPQAGEGAAIEKEQESKIAAAGERISSMGKELEGKLPQREQAPATAKGPIEKMRAAIVEERASDKMLNELKKKKDG